MLSLKFPILGLNRNGKLAEQPPLTSRDLLNVWPTDSTTSRMRGSTRPGMTDYFSGYLAGAGNKIQAIHSLPYQARHVSYSADPVPDEQWAISLTGNPTISCIAPGLFDDFFAIGNTNTRLIHYSRYGIELGNVEIDNAIADMQISALHVASDGAIYVGTTTWVSNFASVASSRYIWKYQLTSDNKAMEFLWSIQPGTSSLPAAFYVIGESLWSLESDVSGAGANSQVQFVEYEGINTATGPTTGQRTVWAAITGTLINIVDGNYPTGGGNVFAHDMHARTAGETAFVCCVGTVRDASAGVWAQFKLTRSNAYNITAPYLFVNDEVNVSANRGGGIGLAVRVDVTGNVYSIGRRATGDPSSGSWLRKLSDTSTAWLKQWERSNATDLGGAANNPGYGYPRIALDEFANLAAPTCFSNIAVDAAKIVKNDGTLFTSIRHREDVTTPPTINNTNNDCRAVAFPSTSPVFQPDDYKSADTVFVSGSNVITITSSATGASIHGYDILLETASPVSSRAVARLGVASGGIYRFTTSGPVVPTNSTGRTPVLNAGARFVQAADCKGEVFFTDGQNYAVYRPLPGDAANPNGEIVEWRANSLGLIPPRARLICRWRGRIVLAHTADSPFAWHMSAFDDPYNWDLDPPDVLETQAVSGSALEALGNVPDLIHALIPWSDDLLFIGCSRSILRLSGDPMAGGRLDVVSDEIGMAFGTPWCKDPEGRVYFFGSSGGVYVMSPIGALTWLTRDTIEADLADVDLSTNRVELTWNSRDNGLHVWILPYGAGGTHVRHYFWSQRTGGWFPVEMGTTTYTDIQPTAVHGVDGDTPAERVMLIGSEDGRILSWDPDSAFDGDQPIFRRVLVGPLAGPDGIFETRWKRPTVILAKELGGANVRFWASDTPETPIMPRSGIRVGPGRNQRLPIGVRGSWCWIELSSASRVGSPDLSEMWALESLVVEAIVAGRAHARS